MDPRESILSSLRKKTVKQSTKTKQKKIPTAKQINRMLTQYRKEDKKAFKDIMLQAEALGIRLESARKYESGRLPNNPKWISESKKRKKVRDTNSGAKRDPVEVLWEKMVNRYGGSYSSYEKRRKRLWETYKKTIENENILRSDGVTTTPLTFENYKKFQKERDEFIDEIYKTAYQIKEYEDYNGLDDTINFTDMRAELDDIFSLHDENLIFQKLQEMKDKYDDQAERYGLDTSF